MSTFDNFNEKRSKLFRFSKLKLFTSPLLSWESMSWKQRHWHIHSFKWKNSYGFMWYGETVARFWKINHALLFCISTCVSVCCSDRMKCVQSYTALCCCMSFREEQQWKGGVEVTVAITWTNYYQCKSACRYSSINQRMVSSVPCWDFLMK